MSVAPGPPGGESSRASGTAAALDRAARVGFVAKGVVYVLMAVFSGVAIAAGRDAEGPAGVVDRLAEMPFAEALLVAIALGLAAYGLWRLVGSALFPATPESGVKGWGKRLGYASTGSAHLLLAGYAAYVALGYEPDGGSAEQAVSARVLALPGGALALGALGVAFFGVAAFQLVQGFRHDPLAPHRVGEMSDAERRAARLVARVGLAARAVVFTTIGLGLVVAAWRARADEVLGLGDALGRLAQQPFGTVLFACVAAGLVAYAVYCFSLARYARFDTSLG